MHIELICPRCASPTRLMLILIPQIECHGVCVSTTFDLRLRCCDWLFPGAVEIPAYLVGCFAMDRIGRKMTCAPALLLAGVSCMLIIVVPAVRTHTHSISHNV